MRRLLVFVLILIGVIFGAGEAFALETSLDITPVSTQTGSTFNVEVILNNAVQIEGVELNLSFDPSFLAVEDANTSQEGIQVTMGSFMDNVIIGKNLADNVDGTVGLAFARIDSGVSGSGVIAVIRFKALKEGTTVLSFSSAKLVDENPKWVTAATGPAVVNITGNGTIAGKVTMQGRNLHTEIMVMDQDSTYVTYTDSSGNFSLSLPSGTYTVYAKTLGYISRKLGDVTMTPGGSVTLPDAMLLAGDANGDDEINLQDLAVLAQQYDSTGTQSSDYNNDQIVDLFDLVLLAKNFNKVGDLVNQTVN